MKPDSKSRLSGLLDDARTLYLPVIETERCPMTRNTHTRAASARILPFRQRALSPFRPAGTMQAEIVPLPEPRAKQQPHPELAMFFEGGGFSG